MRALVLALGVVLLSTGFSRAGDPAANAEWSKESFIRRIGPGMSSSAAPQLVLDSVVWNGERLRGNCTYHNTGSYPVVVEGREVDEKGQPEADFYPELSLQVSNDARSEWKTIGTSPSPDRGKGISISMSPHGAMEGMIRSEANRSCFVEMNLFRPYIGKFAYGRLLAKNGAQSQIFALDDLLRPSRGPASN